MMRMRERDVDNMQDRKIDCFAIDASKAKEAIQKLINYFYASLKNALRKSLDSDLTDLNKFVDDSLGALSSKAGNIDEMQDAMQKSLEVHKKQIEFSKLKRTIDDKARMLKDKKGEVPEKDLMSTLQK